MESFDSVPFFHSAGCHLAFSSWQLPAFGKRRSFSVHYVGIVSRHRLCRHLSSVSHAREFREREDYISYAEHERFEKCAQCELLRFCRGCPAVAFGYTHNFYSPDPQCWKEV